MEVRGVIFDLGHTLMLLDGSWPEVRDRGVADLEAFLANKAPGLDGKLIAQALLDRRIEGYARARQTLREVTAEESVRWAFAQFGLADPDPELVAGAIEAFFAHEGACWRAHPQAVPVLGELTGRGLRLAMYSNATDDRFIQSLVDRFGFRRFLQPALSSAGTGIRKPDPAAFALILQAWGLAPHEAVMVGDTLEEDVLGAQRAGLRSVWLSSRADARQEGSRPSGDAPSPEIVPDLTITRLEDLPGCLLHWPPR